MASIERDPAVLFAAPEVRLSHLDNGAMLLSSPQPLGPFRRCIGEDSSTGRTARRNRCSSPSGRRAEAGANCATATRGGRSGRSPASLLRMAAAAGTAGRRAVRQWHRPCAADAGRLHAGIPYAAVSPAYSLMSQDHAKLRALVARLRPGLLYTASAARYAPALAPSPACTRPRWWRPTRRICRPGCCRFPACWRRTTTQRCSGLRCAWARTRREDPVHLGLDRRAQGRRQHAAHAVREPAVLAQAGRSCADAPPVHRRLAAVEPHLRRQPQLQHGAAPRRHALHRRRQAGARRSIERTVAQPARDPADAVLQRAARLRHAAAATSSATRRCARRSSASCSVIFYAGGGAAARTCGSGSSASRGDARRARADGLGVGLDRDVAARHRRAFPDRARRRDRRCRRRACELKLAPVGGKLEMRVRGPERHAGLLARSRS